MIRLVGSFIIHVFYMCILIIAIFFTAENLQYYWVTTALSTQSHQHLARLVASEKTIARIKAATPSLEDEVPVQNTSLIEERIKFKVAEKKEGEVIPIKAQSIETEREGYKKLEEGIYLKDVSGAGWSGKLMLIEDPSRLFVGLTRTPGHRGDTVKMMADFTYATAGINGGWFIDPNYEGNGGIPVGFVIQNGYVTYTHSDDSVNLVGINKEGVLIAGKYTKQEALDAEIMWAMSSYPILVQNGEGIITEGTGGWGIAPRTAIGQMKTGEILFLTIDGRQAHSLGSDLRPVQDCMLENEAITAVCLDGGSSTVMYYRRDYLNKPSLGHERYIPTSWLIK